MHAHFERHAYHRHSHETYSFGVTDDGAQAFTCRGAGHTSTAGMVMAFNPEDPHDGKAADAFGFTYRMVHIGPELVADVLTQSAGRRAAGRRAAGRRAGLPLFAEPVVHDPVLAAGLRRLHAALLGGAPALLGDELLDAVVLAAVRRAAIGGPGQRRATAAPAASAIARRVAERLHDDYRTDLTADALAAVSGSSRFAVYRAFRAMYGMAPSDYQRQVRLRAARRLLAGGAPIAEAASETGFADQSHLTRWFVRSYGITPGTYRRGSP
ncbi:AraC family transcriptional regulator [Streptosporangium album]